MRSKPLHGSNSLAMAPPQSSHRVRSSRAAFLVKVVIRMFSGRTSSTKTERRARSTSTVVLPDPGPATICSTESPPCVTASNCALLSGSLRSRPVDSLTIAKKRSSPINFYSLSLFPTWVHCVNSVEYLWPRRIGLLYSPISKCISPQST